MTRFTNFTSGRSRLVLAGAALLAVGGGVGAAITEATRPAAVMAPAAPVRIASLATTAEPWFGAQTVTVRGRVVELFGNRFVLDDGSGRALIDTGHEGAGPVALGRIITVQGRFDDGSVHAAFLVGPDGRVIALRPHGHPHGGSRDRDHGPRGDGPRDRDASPNAGPGAPA